MVRIRRGFAQAEWNVVHAETVLQVAPRAHAWENGLGITCAVQWRLPTTHEKDRGESWTHVDYESVLLPLNTHRPHRGRSFLIAILAILVLFLFGIRTLVSYYVDTLWYGSLGYADVFWKTQGLQWSVFAIFAAVTFVVLYGWFLFLLRASHLDLRNAGTIVIGSRTIQLPVEGALRISALVLGGIIALATGASMMADWPRFALWWFAPHAAGGVVDPIFGRPLGFYLFTLPVWQFVSGWLLMLAIM